MSAVRHPVAARRLALACGLLVALCLAALCLAGPALASSRRAATDSLDARVEVTLARHLDGARIAAWLETLPAGSLEDEAARWILAWLPLSDCAELTLPLLREHVEGAAAAYRESPWRETIPHALWLHFVVPHRVSQEPAQPWRAAFARALAPRIAGAASMEAAALAVNRWCREQATYTPSSGRDLGPLGTIARGLGRCEEETILTVSALRAAGLPARSCATPYWTFTDSNHAWVEVWADGAWHYLGGCEPDRCLDRAWFTGAARRAGFVRSAAYGEFDPAPEPLYRAELGVTLINSTPVYADAIHLRAALAPEIAAECTGELSVNVLNFGSLRALAKVKDGGEIVLGPGEYALTAGNDSTLYLRVVGGGGASGTRLEVTLDAGDRYDLDAAPGFWLRYPEEDARPARDLNLVSAAEEAALARGIAARDADRRKLRELSSAEAAQLDSLPDAQASRLQALLETKPLSRASTLFALLAAAGDSLAREDLLAVLEAMDDKDLIELGEETIAGELALAQAQRGRLAALGLVAPDSLLRAGLLANRIDRETAAAWRAGLPLLAPAATAAADLEALLAAFRARVRAVPAGYHGSPLDPAQCWALGLGTEEDLGTCLVGLLRRNGWPARLRYGVSEVWQGEWRALDPLAGTLKAAPGAAGALGRLALTVTRDAQPDTLAESYLHFNVARLKAGTCQSPWWDPVLGEQDWDAGDFVFSTANRVPGGSAYGRLKRFRVEPGALAQVSLPLDIGSGWSLGASAFTGPRPEAIADALAAGGLAPAGEGLMLLFPPGEPAARMITACGRLAPRLAARGLALRPIFLSGETAALADPAPWREKLAAVGLAAPLDLLPAAPARALAGADGPAPIVLLILNGEPRLARQGLDDSVDVTVNLLLDLERAAP